MSTPASKGPRGVLGTHMVLAGLTVAALAPFFGKAFHMDDPLFIWTAKHFRFAPFDFYGFDVNWEGTLARMSSVTQNPPLAAYYMALVGAIAGWTEVALHAGFLVPAVAVIVGTGRLARLFGVDEVLAGACVIAAPIFIVSSTSVMCDTMMLAFWLWAVTSWIEGLRRGRRAPVVLVGGVGIGREPDKVLRHLAAAADGRLRMAGSQAPAHVAAVPGGASRGAGHLSVVDDSTLRTRVASERRRVCHAVAGWRRVALKGDRDMCVHRWRGGGPSVCRAVAMGPQTPRSRRGLS